MKIKYVSLIIIMLFFILIVLIYCSNKETIVTSTVYTTTTENFTQWTYSIISEPSGLEWKTISQGTYLMGDNELGASFTYNGCNPAHSVQVSSFSINKTEITIKQYVNWLNKLSTMTDINSSNYYSDNMINSTYCGITRINGSVTTYDVTLTNANKPMVYVSWYNAKAFCQSFGGDLPSEAQWEYACAGENHTKFSLSDTFGCTNYSCDIAPCWRYNSSDVMSSGTSNIFGLYDMSGNVNEWCSDLFSSTFYSNWSAPQTIVPVNPLNNTIGNEHVIKGGSWSSYEEYYLRTAFKSYYNSTSMTYNIGFRCVK